MCLPLLLLMRAGGSQMHWPRALLEATSDIVCRRCNSPGLAMRQGQAKGAVWSSGSEVARVESRGSEGLKMGVKHGGFVMESKPTAEHGVLDGTED